MAASANVRPTRIRASPSSADRWSPVLVAGGVSFAAVRAGGNHTCGVTAVGAAYCWGFNGYGQLGDGTTIDRLTPGRVVL